MIPIHQLKVNPSNWAKKIYIAKKLRVGVDNHGHQKIEYDNPMPYLFNVQTTLTDSEIAEFGEKSTSMQRAVIPIAYEGCFKEFDVAYLDGATPDGEKTPGSNANYKLLPPRNGNSVIIIYFEKLAGK